MEILQINGNILDATTDVIAHQVNCQGVMGAGLAKQIRDKWPNVFTHYKDYCNRNTDEWGSIKDLLGSCQIIEFPDKYIANLFGQDKYGRDKRYTNYDAIYTALNNLAVQMMDNGIESVAFPYGMSCGLAGGDWRIIMTMIECVFENTNIRIEIWKL